jgi:hypothetical protein
VVHYLWRNNVNIHGIAGMSGNGSKARFTGFNRPGGGDCPRIKVGTALLRMVSFPFNGGTGTVASANVPRL